MSKDKQKRSRKPRRGECWFVQRTAGNPLLAVEIDEATPATVLIRFLPDGSVQPKANAIALRFLRTDLNFIERVRG